MKSENEGSMDKSGYKQANQNNVKDKKRGIYVRDKEAPKPPLSGYIRFLNEERKQFRSENKNLSLTEVTKVLATKWTQLPADKKQQYLIPAEQERVKYEQNLAAYKKTDAYKNFLEYKLKRKKAYSILQDRESKKEKLNKEQELRKQKHSDYIKFKKEQELRKQKLYFKFKNEQELKKEKSSNDNKLKKEQELKKEKSSNDSQLKKEQELKKEKPSNDSQLKKEQELKKEKSSNGSKLKKEQELKKEKSSNDSKLKKDQELKIEKPSIDNSNTVDGIPIFSEEFLNFNEARENELRDICLKVKDQEQEVCVLDKHIENMQNGSIKLTANTEKLKAGCSNYEQYIIKLRSSFLEAFANTHSLGITEPLTNETIDTYIVALAALLTSGNSTDSSWIENIKRALSNFDPSQC